MKNNCNSHWKKVSADSIPSSLELFPAFFERVAPDKKVLDAGCGSGRISLDLIARGFISVFGTDINLNGISLAQKNLKSINTPLAPVFCCADTALLPFRNNSFDAVITQAFWTCTHDESRQQIMDEISRVTATGGIIYIADFAINNSIPLYRERYKAGASKGWHYGNFEVLADDGTCLYRARHFERSELETLLDRSGFRTEYYSCEQLPTRSGNIVSGHIITGRK